MWPHGRHYLWVVYLLILGSHNRRTGVKAASFLTSNLCSAVESGQLAAVQKILKDPGVNVNEGCSFANAFHPLGKAASRGLVDIGRLLISRGADVNQEELLGYTPVLRAAESLHLKFLQLLVDSGANVRATLLPLKGMDLGFNALNLATSGYLGKYPFVSAEERVGLTELYLAIARLLSSKCYPAELMQSSIRRLKDENHDEEAAEIQKIATRRPTLCPSQADARVGPTH